MRKSTLFKISSASLFGEIKKELPPNRRLQKLEARLLARVKDESIREHPRSTDYRLFVKLAQEAFGREDFKGAFFLAKKCLSLIKEYSITIGDVEKAQLYKLIGVIYRENNNTKQSVEFLKESLELTNSVLGEENMYSDSIIYELARSYAENHMANEAITYYQMFLLSKKLGVENIDEKTMKALIELVVVYYFNLDFKSALRVINSALKKNRKRSEKDNKYILYLLLCKANVHAYLKQFDLSDKSFKQFLYIYKMTPNKYKKSDEIYDGLISYYFATRKNVCALNFSKEAVRSSRTFKGDNQLSIARYYRLISAVYKLEGNIPDSNKYLHKSLIVLRKTAPSNNPAFLNCVVEHIAALIVTQQYRKALEYFRKIHKDLKPIISSSNAHYMWYNLIKGVIYMNLGFPKKALDRLEIAEFLTKIIYGENSYHKAIFMQYRAMILYLECDFHSSMNEFEKVLTLYSEIFSKSSSQYISACTYIGILYEKTGQIEESLKCFKQCLYLANKTERHNFARLINANIACLYWNKGKLNYFFKYIIQAINSIQKDYFGVEANWNLVLLPMFHYYTNYGNYKAAYRTMTRILKCQISTYGLNSYGMLEAFYELAHLEILQKNTTRANEIFELCRMMIRQWVKAGLIHENDKMHANLYYLRAIIRKSVHQYEDSLRDLEKCIRLNLNFYDKYNPNLYHLYIETAAICFSLERYHRAIEYFKIALKTQLKGYQDPVHTSGICSCIGALYYKIGSIDKAIEYCKCLLKIDKKIKKKRHEELIISYYLIANMYSSLGSYTKSLKYFCKALSHVKTIEEMSLSDTCILNDMGCVVAYQGFFAIALKIIELCVKNAQRSAPDRIYQKILENCQAVRIAAETARGSKRVSIRLARLIRYVIQGFS